MRPKLATASRYTLAEELGAGGMGIVRGAVDRRLGREVAIKTLRRTKRPQRPLERRFLREACVQALLDHPAIIPVYDIGRDREGSLYFSMKRVVGTTLEAIAADLTVTKRLEAFARVCRAVHFAHRRGVVHRDLKPANIMLTDDGDVYVLDWGVAALIDFPDPLLPAISSVLLADAESPARTLDGETIGTPGYLAPEQARGAIVDARADIYALGAVLFELLALEPLHPRRSTTTILVSTLRGADARPSVRAPERDIAPELDAICVRATALDPADRFQTLAELVDALEPLLAATATAATPPAEDVVMPPLIPFGGRTRGRINLSRALVLFITVVASAAWVSHARVDEPDRSQRTAIRSIRLDRRPQSLSIGAR